jgi:nitrogen fixation/metabolism regulation signal transduction histidine kinase
MKFDLKGRIDSTNLPKTKHLFPLFEAVVNSIQAIEDASAEKGKIDVIIERDYSQQHLDTTTKEYPIKNIIIKDNGIGFTNKNYNSFKTAHTTLKIKRGGKGVGRFIWLKTFEKVQIKSVFYI